MTTYVREMDCYIREIEACRGEMTLYSREIAADRTENVPDEPEMKAEKREMAVNIMPKGIYNTTIQGDP